MGYPTGVFSPSARTNGQTIDAAHVNDVQTEIAAVETALLGTITHSVNVSGNSTLGALSAGASTLATLQCAGSTFSVRPVEPPPDAVRVYLDADAALGSSAASTIAWTGQAFLTNSSLHSTGTNPTRLIPQTTGIYQITVLAAFSSNSTGLRQLVLRDSSGASFADIVASSAASVIDLQLVGYKRFDALGGYVVACVEMTGASTLSLASGFGETHLTMHKL